MNLDLPPPPGLRYWFNLRGFGLSQLKELRMEMEIWNPPSWESELSLHSDMTRVYGDAWRAYLSLGLDDPIDDCYAGSADDWEDFVIEHAIRRGFMAQLQPLTEDSYEVLLNYGYELSQNHDGTRVNGTMHFFRIPPDFSGRR